jgi:cobalt-zinc-cadmium efflux system outer membrane protein
LSLDAALAEAFAKSPVMRVIDAEIEAARGEVLTAQTRPNPELSFTPGLKQVRDSGDSHNEFKASVAVSQVFLAPGRRELLVSIAQRNVELRKLGIEGLRFQLAAEVRKSFYELLAAQSILGLRGQQLESARTFQQAATKRAESGYASDFEAVKSQGEVINAQKLLRMAEGQIATARVQLNALLGRDPLAPLEIVGTLDGAAPALPLSALLSLAYERNPSIRVQEMQAEIAGMNVRKARLARRSDYAVGPAVEYSKSEQVIGLSATISLPRKNYGQGEILTATAEQRRALAEIERLRREIAGAVAKSATELATAQSVLVLYSPVYLDQLKAVVEQAERSYAQNATSLLIYLDAKRTYFDTLASYYEAIGGVATSRAELESALGVPLETNPSLSTP